MSEVTYSIFASAIAIVVGGYVTHLDFENFVYVISVAGAIIIVINISASLRRNDPVSAIFTTIRGMKYSLNGIEKVLSAFGLALLASPFLYMLGAGLYG